MSDYQFSVGIAPETQRLVARMEDFPDRILPAMARGMSRAAQIAAGRIVQKRLSGQGPFPVRDHRLGVVTSRLRSSVRATEAEISGGQVSVTIGTNVEYAAAHEFGFKGKVQVPQHSRAVRSRDTFADVSRMTAGGRVRKTRERMSSGVTIVKAHARMMNIPARAPFGYGAADEAGTFNREILRELSQEVDAL